MKIDARAFERGAQVYPQPVALSCGRICRARNLQEQLDAVLRCAETLTRYLAVVAIASFAARDDATAESPQALANFQGNLSFGHFLAVLQGVSTVTCEHPLKSEFASGFRRKEDTGPVETSLAALLKLRNRIGHNLASLTEAQVKTCFQMDTPHEHLQTALKESEALLGLPLFLMEEQRFDKGDIVGRCLFLMGESSDPLPEEVKLATPLGDDHVLYVGIRDGVLPLFPMLHWEVVLSKYNYAVYLIHAHEHQHIKFITMDGDASEQNGAFAQELRSRLSGTLAKEQVALKDGRSFAQDWREKRQVIERLRSEMGGVVEWSKLDPESVRWYGQKLGATGTDDAQTVIVEQLLGGRDVLTPAEWRQVVLLLGSRAAVQDSVRRIMLDCRARTTPDVRWDDRTESDENVLQCLRMSIDFFSRHVGKETTTIDGLRATSGSSDYVAMREALVNLFIHQDYQDQTTVAQIEITPDRTTFFNAGKSLVAKTALAEGGKSQSRNPLLSRALRLIGFAELAGSGLSAVNSAWRQAHRRPPTVESNPSANTFTLTLDWRELPDISDEFWNKRLGVRISQDEARILLLAGEPQGTTVEEVAASQGMRVDDARRMIQHLVVQTLVKEQGGKVLLEQRLQSLAQEAKRQVEDPST